MYCADNEKTQLGQALGRSVIVIVIGQQEEMGSDGAVLGMGKKGARRERFGGRIGKMQPLTDSGSGAGQEGGKLCSGS